MSGGLTLISDVWDAGELSSSDVREFVSLGLKSLRTNSNGVTDAISCRVPSGVCLQSRHHALWGCVLQCLPCGVTLTVR